MVCKTNRGFTTKGSRYSPKYCGALKTTRVAKAKSNAVKQVKSVYAECDGKGVKL